MNENVLGVESLENDLAGDSCSDGDFEEQPSFCNQLSAVHPQCDFVFLI